MTNKEKLQKIMLENKLSVRQISEMLQVSEKTVFTWLTNKKWGVKIRDQTIDLLNYKMKETQFLNNRF